MKINKPLYYFLNCTWGIIMTLIGAVVALVLLVTGHKPKLHAGAIYFNVGKYWGGVELGLFFITDESDSKDVKDHEFGHSLQNCLWGPLFPFVVCLPSAARYWFRECKTQVDKLGFSLALLAISGAMMIILAFIGVVIQQMWMIYVMLFVALYVAILTYWLACIELPRYEQKTPPYDDVWFEGQATRWGTKIAERW